MPWKRQLVVASPIPSLPDPTRLVFDLLGLESARLGVGQYRQTRERPQNSPSASTNPILSPILESTDAPLTRVGLDCPTNEQRMPGNEYQHSSSRRPFSLRLCQTQPAQLFLNLVSSTRTTPKRISRRKYVNPTTHHQLSTDSRRPQVLQRATRRGCLTRRAGRSCLDDVSAKPGNEEDVLQTHLKVAFDLMLMSTAVEPKSSRMQICVNEVQRLGPWCAATRVLKSVSFCGAGTNVFECEHGGTRREGGGLVAGFKRLREVVSGCACG
uniref:Uncharacterized protein n=1 Tax=Mycena chlorophos TaxID=658473 RepID=A0ABQ0LK74_MYCCL|nr:predicted protein [Mycena chlorophos]